jgi:hypothetical protein
MGKKTLIWAGMLIGSTIGSIIPSIWGAGMFSVSSVLGTGIGALLGIWVAYKLSD